MATADPLPARDIETVRAELNAFACRRLSAPLSVVEQDWYVLLCGEERELLGWPRPTAAPAADPT
jgi:hypothetical protein